MEKIVIEYLSNAHHLNQILTGFYLLKDKYNVIFEDHIHDKNYKYKKTACIVNYNGKKIFYDMADGYQNFDVINYFLDNTDFYFKRSFSEKINLENNLNEIYPLGLYYDVSFLSNPLNKFRKFGYFRFILENMFNNFNSVDFFENKADYKKNNIKILFNCKLWEKEEKLSKEDNDDREYINNTRIKTVKLLKKHFPNNFIGGLYDTEISREIVPDLIIDKSLTKRSNYIKNMKNCDICIATTGLHKSIGAKLGEYVAAARGIVSEKLNFSVTGDFLNAKNYYGFETPEECCDIVNYLLKNPEKLYEMKLANEQYYKEYLHPKQLILNSLKKVDDII